MTDVKNRVEKRYIYIDKDELAWHKDHLLNGKNYKEYGQDSTIQYYSVDLEGSLFLDLKVCNASEEDGGAYVDPVVMEDFGKYCSEFLVGDVLDDLDYFEVVIDDVTYQIQVLPYEKERN